MTQTLNPTAFAADFASATEDDWRRAAEAALKGKPLDTALGFRTIDGLPVTPLAARRTPRPIAGRPAGARWTAMSRIDLSDPEAANAQALEDLNNGASGLSITFAPFRGDGGLVADTLDRLDRALDGVLLDLAPIRLDVLPFGGWLSSALAIALVERRGLRPADVQLLFSVDILRDLARIGALPLSWADHGRRLAGGVMSAHRRGFVSPVLAIDAIVFHGAGASEAQELAGALASATAHLRLLVQSGVPIEIAADTVSFAFACDADQFATIAKLRAARLLWAAVRRDCGLPERPVHIHAETSRRMMARRDPDTNLIRTTIAAFAAGVGGADSVTVLPHTFARDAVGPDARRLARNAQAILLEEANVHRVADPAAGAGAIEALTDTLAERAWGLFRDIERRGGMLDALTSGAWQAAIAETRAARDAAVATRRMAIVGVSEFPKDDEPPPEAPAPAAPAAAPRTRDLPPVAETTIEGFDAAVQAFLDRASMADLRAAMTPRPGSFATPLDLARLAAPFEMLSDASAQASRRPAAFLALIGPIPRHAARAGFMRNLLAAGGVATIDGPVGGDPAATARAFAASATSFAVICGSDDGYAEQGVATAEALAAEGAVLWLAGRPKDGVNALAAAGVTRFVAAGDDMVATLRDAAALPADPQGAAA